MEKITQSLDRIQYEVFEKLEELAHIHQTELEDSLEAENEKLVKQIGRLLSLYRDNLRALEVYVSSDNDKVMHEIYCSKYLKLKSKYREIQLLVNENENQFIHQQRVAKYGTKEREEEVDARELLFKGRRTGKTKDMSKETIGGQILQTNVKITNTLQTTKQLIESTILQTELNIDSLDSQSKDINELNESLFKLSDVLAKSANIVRFIEKQDKEDKRKIYLSICFFLCCCAWVTWRRILKTPVLFFIWSLLKTFKIINWSVGTTRNALKSHGNPAQHYNHIESYSSNQESSTTAKASNIKQKSSFIDSMSDFIIPIGETETASSTDIPHRSVEYIKDEL